MAWRFPPCSSAGRTVTSNAEVEDREAAGWVEPATVEPSSFPTQGVVLGSQAPVTATGESCQTHSGERPRTRPGTDSLGRYVDLPRHGKHTAYDRAGTVPQRSGRAAFAGPGNGFGLRNHRRAGSSVSTVCNWSTTDFSSRRRPSLSRRGATRAFAQRLTLRGVEPVTCARPAWSMTPVPISWSRSPPNLGNAYSLQSCYSTLPAGSPCARDERR